MTQSELKELIKEAYEEVKANKGLNTVHNDHDETDDTPEENKEVELAKKIKKFANELIKMHEPEDEDEDSEEESDDESDKEEKEDNSDDDEKEEESEEENDDDKKELNENESDEYEKELQYYDDLVKNPKSLIRKADEKLYWSVDKNDWVDNADVASQLTDDEIKALRNNLPEKLRTDAATIVPILAIHPDDELNESKMKKKLVEYCIKKKGLNKKAALKVINEAIKSPKIRKKLISEVGHQLHNDSDFFARYKGSTSKEELKDKLLKDLDTISDLIDKENALGNKAKVGELRDEYFKIQKQLRSMGVADIPSPSGETFLETSIMSEVNKSENENVQRWLDNEHYESLMRQISSDIYVANKNNIPSNEVKEAVDEFLDIIRYNLTNFLGENKNG